MTEKELLTQYPILKKLNNKRNGAYFKIQYCTSCARDIKSSERNNTVMKITEMSVRKGINYKNTKGYKEVDNHRGSYYNHIDNMILEKNGKYYLMLYPNKFGKPNSRMYLNGEVISREELRDRGIMRDSYWKEKSRAEVITIGIDKIVNVW